MKRSWGVSRGDVNAVKGFVGWCNRCVCWGSFIKGRGFAGCGMGVPYVHPTNWWAWLCDCHGSIAAALDAQEGRHALERQAALDALLAEHRSLMSLASKEVRCGVKMGRAQLLWLR